MRNDITAAEFDLIASLIRSRDPVRSAARRVLVDGVRNVDAAREAGIEPARVNNSAARIRRAVDQARGVFKAHSLGHDEMNDAAAQALLKNLQSEPKP